MTSLLVKHLPTCLSEAALKEFFTHFGAQEIRLLTGKMRGCAVIKFSDPIQAKRGISQLHGLKLLDKTLSVDFAKQSIEEVVSFQLTLISLREESNIPSVKKSRKRISSIAANLGINYPSPPYLEYAYPRPNKSIVDNIANALYNVPKFYEQVLHLMNKMNLPIPFGPPLPGPPSQEARKKRKRKETELSDSESEIESEEDSDKERERKRRKVEEEWKKAKERHEINIQHQITRPLKPTAPALQIKLQTSQPEQILSRVTSNTSTTSSTSTTEPLPSVSSDSSFTFPPNVQIPYTTGDATAYQQLVTPSILPVQDQPSRKVISSHELQSNKKTTEQILQEFPKFKNYNCGEPSNKLFVKNIDKNVTEEDLFYIFARYFQTDDEAHRDLKIDLFTQGRLKGQAFITFPCVEMATQALEEVHGFVLKGKPLVIEYGKKKDKDN